MPNNKPRLSVYFEEDEIELLKVVSKENHLTPASYVKFKVMPILKRDAKKMEAAS